MTSGHFRQAGTYVAACVLAAAAMLVAAEAQPPETAGSAIVHGYVRDSNRRLLANASVFLKVGTFEQALAAPTQTTHTDSEGHYRFEALRAGAYTLRAEMTGYNGATVTPVNLAQSETTKIDFVLTATKASELLGAPPATPTTAKSAAPAPEFFDEPTFTVAGITQATGAGGHGSDTVLRTTEALARATVSLSKEPAADAKSRAATTESSLLKAVALNPKDAALHHQLGDVEEELGHPLEAVREYQRAAELDPSELYLFDWGTELLTHRALEPATEVFTTGNRLFPKSVRMLIGLGVAWYARGSYDRAAQFLGNASELAPEDPTPYLFIGKMQSAETVPTKESVERLARFQQYEPGNSLANYYYAVSLWKWRQSVSALDDASSAQIEALLQKAVQLDSKLGAAYLQLGILYAQRGDYTRAIPAYQKAIEVSPELEEPHYRLAQAYLRTGDKTKAQEELELNRQLYKKTKDDAERKRREIQQFVIALRDKNSTSQPQN